MRGRRRWYWRPHMTLCLKIPLSLSRLHALAIQVRLPLIILGHAKQRLSFVKYTMVVLTAQE